MLLRILIITGLMAWALSLGPKAEAFIIINEILADPPTGMAGDANADGATSSSQDEFIELFNSLEGTIDMTGWYLADGLKTRHIFGANRKLPAGNFLVVFGGGSPELPGIEWVTATSGSLGLNNGGDSVILYDALGQVVQQVTYGSEAGHDQSIVRSPEGSSGAFVQHTELPHANGARYSPGYFINPLTPEPEASGSPMSSAVPEPASLLLVAVGAGAVLMGARGNKIAV